MNICELHKDAIVVYDTLGAFKCPVCQHIDDLKAEIVKTEVALNTFEEGKKKI